MTDSHPAARSAQRRRLAHGAPSAGLVPRRRRDPPVADRRPRSARSPSPATSASAPPPTPSRPRCGSRTCCRTSSARACCRRRSSPCTPGSSTRTGSEADRLAGAIARSPAARVMAALVAARDPARPPAHRRAHARASSGERLELAVTLLRIMFPGIGFLVLSAWCLGHPQQPPPFFLSYVVAGDVERRPDRVRRGRRRCGARPRRASPTRSPGAWSSAGCSQLAVQLPAVRRPDPRACGCRLDRPVRRRAGRPPAASAPWSSAAASCSSSPTSTCSSPASSRSARVSALTYGQVLYLLPISLFGMAVAAAELPELSRLGRAGAAAIARAPRTSGMERITFYVALTVALYVFAGDVIVGALLAAGRVRRRRHPARLVRARRVRARAARHHPLAPAPERPLRARPPQAGRAHRGASASRWPACSARCSCSRSTGSPSSTGPSRRSATSRSGPLPDSRAAARGRPAAARASSASPSAPRLSSWVEYRLLRGRARVADRALPPTGPRLPLVRSSPPRGCGVLAAGLRSVTDDLPAAGRRGRRRASRRRSCTS